MARIVLDPERHSRVTRRLILQTVSGFFGLFLVSAWVASLPETHVLRLALGPLAIVQGLWLYRLYVVGHEGAHGKLFPNHARRNDLVASLLLLPLLVPLRVFRKIHRFHHGHNRRDTHTSALETFDFGRPIGPFRRAWCWLVWGVAVFGGGWFWHSVVSILLFLFVPPSMAERISPAFRGWSASDLAHSAAIFGGAVGLHVGVGWTLGATTWVWCLGLPICVFAWIYSLFLYIYHYRTTYGAPVGLNARSLRPHPFFSWLLLNFNEHVTHHAKPGLPWYLLPEHRVVLPASHTSNERVQTLGAAVWNQLRGPVIIEEIS